MYDFGLARHVSSVSSLTGDRGFVGTIDYVPPEQIAGGAIDRRADVYSLGCVLFECLAGARPFERESELSVVFAHLNEPPPGLRLQAGPAASIRRRLRHCVGQVAGRALRHLQGAGRGGARRPCAARDPRGPVARAGDCTPWGGAASIVAAAAIAGFVLARDEATPSAVSISQTSIAGATLGRSEEAFKELYGTRLARGRRHRTRLPRPHLRASPASDLLPPGHEAQQHRHNLES